MLTIAGGIILAGVIGIAGCFIINAFMHWVDKGADEAYRKGFTDPRPPSD